MRKLVTLTAMGLSFLAGAYIFASPRTCYKMFKVRGRWFSIRMRADWFCVDQLLLHTFGKVEAGGIYASERFIILLRRFLLDLNWGRRCKPQAPTGPIHLDGFSEWMATVGKGSRWEDRSWRRVSSRYSLVWPPLEEEDE